MYARVLERTPQSIRVTIDPYESNTFSVTPSKVWPIPSFCEPILASSNVRNTIKLIHDPFQVSLLFVLAVDTLLTYLVQDIYQEVSKLIRSGSLKMLTVFCDIPEEFANRVREPFVPTDEYLDESVFSLKDCKTLCKVMRCIEDLTQHEMLLYDQVMPLSHFLSLFFRPSWNLPFLFSD
jgi:hypothetical protein